MPQFKLGNSGKLKGTKDNRQFSLSFWFNLLIEQYPELTANQKANISLECWKVLINRSKNVALDLNSSQLNAEQASKLLAEVEAKSSVVKTETPPKA